MATIGVKLVNAVGDLAVRFNEGHDVKVVIEELSDDGRSTCWSGIVGISLQNNLDGELVLVLLKKEA